jgi:hypothetical protein
MRCANAGCCNSSFDLRRGALRLMELDISRDPLIENEDNGFPCRARPAKYFWLCIECSEKYSLCRWTPSGVVLVPKHLHTQNDGPRLSSSTVQNGRSEFELKPMSI